MPPPEVPLPVEPLVPLEPLVPFEPLEPEHELGATRGRWLRLGGRRRRGDRCGAGRLVAARVELACEVAEVGEQLAPVVGADRLGMELHAPLRAQLVGDGHQHAVARPGEPAFIIARRRQIGGVGGPQPERRVHHLVAPLAPNA